MWLKLRVATFVINTEAVEPNMASFSLSYNGAPIYSSDISLYIDVNGTIKRFDGLSSDVNGLLELDLALLGYNNGISNGAYSIGFSTLVNGTDYYYYIEDGVVIDFNESVFSAYSVDLDKGTTCTVDAIYPSSTQKFSVTIDYSSDSIVQGVFSHFEDESEFLAFDYRVDGGDIIVDTDFLCTVTGDSHSLLPTLSFYASNDANSIVTYFIDDYTFTSAVEGEVDTVTDLSASNPIDLSAIVLTQ